MKKILFPTDFSETANNAFVYALHLAQELRSELIVLHVYNLPVLSATHAGQLDRLADMYENFERQETESFKKNSDSLRKLAHDHQISHVNISYRIQKGDLVRSVNAIIKQEHVDLVIMGTNGASGISAKIIGSNTVNVIRNTQVPVLSVPYEAKYSGITEIAFTTLFREKDEPALQEFISIARPLGAKVKCLHVLKNRNVDIIMIIEKWEYNFAAANLEFEIIDFKDSVEKSIATYIAEHKVDILGVVKRNRSFFDSLFTTSVSNQLTFHAKTPTLVFHED